jgi:hypothetical protein
MSIYDPPKHAPLAFLFGQDAAVFCRSYMAWLAYHLGEPERARSCRAEALATCDELGPPIGPGFVEQLAALRKGGFKSDPQLTRGFEEQYAAALSRGMAEHYAATLGCLLGDFDDAELHARTLIEMATQVGVPHWESLGQSELERARTLIEMATEAWVPHWVSFAQIHRGWAMVGRHGYAPASQAERVRCAEAAASIRAGLSRFLGVGIRVSLSYWRAALVLAEIGAGNLDEAEALLSDTLRFIETSDERYFEPELHLLAGEIALARAATSEARAQAEAAFHKALEVAQSQEALGLAARVTARLVAIKNVPSAGE